MFPAEPAPVAEAGTLRVLELPAIVDMLAALTSFTPSRELALAMAPSGDVDEVERLHEQTDEAARLLDEQAHAGVGPARDIRRALDRAARGGRLDPHELLEIADTLRAAGDLAERLAGWRGRHLTAVSRDLDAAPELRAQIERSVDDAGEILDSASPELAAVRKRLRTAQTRVRERLNAILRAGENAGAIGEPIVTLRAGRYVIPVRAEARSRIPGIVHDQSASGATLFVEPMGVVDLNNAWTQATIDEQREVERVLEALSREVEARAEGLRGSLVALARADLWIARARLARQLDAIRPADALGAVELLTARHPLLGPSAVPIDIRIGQAFGYRAVIITGPNTGGKTVSLKTVGLLALMHQSGLRIPVSAGSRLPVFASVMADIGDEQSIAQSLSTFSSHLRNVVRFVAEAGPRSLVLLDEIGAGTDPTEGSALAMAVVARLLEQSAMVIATTHYAELKAFAQTHAGVTNAAVEFDVQTLQPTYRLTIGLPGKSQAFAIAERLGLPRRILDDARSRLSAEQTSFEETLAAIARAEVERGEELERARREREAARSERERARSGVGRARAEAAQILRDARRAADALYAAAEREIAELRREAGRTSERRSGAVPARDALRRLERRAAERRTALASSQEATAAEPQQAEEPAAPEQPRVGAWARSRTLGRVGRVVEISGRTGRATLETDEARLVVPGDDLEVVPEPATVPNGDDVRSAELRRQAASRVSPQLDLRGERVEAALELLDAYLDEVALAGLEQVRIVHGAGTGALRRSIRERLAEHPQVRAVRSGTRQEGGDGATVAEL